MRRWLILAAGMLAASCTALGERTPVMVIVTVEADSVVRDETVRVEIAIDGERAEGSGWKNLDQRAYRADPRPVRWPIEFRLEPDQAMAASFSLLAIAYDARESVVARAQAIRTGAQANENGLRVSFDAACYRMPTLCVEGTTCHRGTCVSAREEQPPLQESDAGALDSGVTVPGLPGDGVSMEGEGCRDGERACSGHGSRTPLECAAGMWRAAMDCAEDERCDTSRGAERGSCKPIASECRNQEVNVPFCNDGKMLVCTDLVSSQIRPCDENSRCAPGPSGAVCKCEPGYVADGPRCVPGTECGDDNGGCDPLTECRMDGDERSCSECPPGFEGTGKTGCKPLLQDLTLSAGVLDPPFDPSVREYVVRVSVAVPRVALTARAPVQAQVSFDSVAVPNGQPWTTPMLELGSRSVELRLTTELGESTSYVFTIERSAVQEWFVKASNAEEDDWFGFSPALSGTRFIVGAPREDSAATKVGGDEGNGAENSGAAYVFVQSGDTWAQEGYLKASDTQAGDNFGISTAIDGDTVAVGASRIDFSGVTGDPTTRDRSGTAYVFTRAGDGWSQQQQLQAGMPSAGDQFGSAMALAGDTLAVAALSGDGTPGGAVYVFERMSARWSERQVLTPSGAGGEFGRDVAIDGDRMVIGAPTEDGASGAAYVFDRGSDGWVETQRLRGDSIGGGSKFGWTVAMRGERLAVGAPHHPDSGSIAQVPEGEVYIFDLVGGSWTQTALLRASIPDRNDYFGIALGFSSHGLAVGANGDYSGGAGVNGDATDNGTAWAGAAYVFTDTGMEWVSSVYLKPTNPAFDYDFGLGVAIDDDVLLVSACFEGTAARGVNATPPKNSSAYRSGAVYIFR